LTSKPTKLMPTAKCSLIFVTILDEAIDFLLDCENKLIPTNPNGRLSRRYEVKVTGG
jgi:hypothetical protein